MRKIFLKEGKCTVVPICHHNIENPYDLESYDYLTQSHIGRLFKFFNNELKNDQHIRLAYHKRVRAAGIRQVKNISNEDIKKYDDLLSGILT